MGPKYIFYTYMDALGKALSILNPTLLIPRNSRPRGLGFRVEGRFSVLVPPLRRATSLEEGARLGSFCLSGYVGVPRVPTSACLGMSRKTYEVLGI